MKLSETQARVAAFIVGNPKCTAQSIIEGTKMQRLTVFAALKKLKDEELIADEVKGEDRFYSITKNFAPPEAEAVSDKQTDGKKKKESVPQEKSGSQQAGRDSRKFKFNNEEYGKGPLVFAVVRQYVADNPRTTINKLREVFPDELLHRFGIFQEIREAKKLSGDRPRFFMKDEQKIKLKDGKVVVVCNQFTAENIKPFLKAAKALGYNIK